MGNRLNKSSLRISAVLFILCALFLPPRIRFDWYIPARAATSCDDPSGFLKSFGTIPLGDLLILGPDCQHVQDGGNSISNFVACLGIDDTTTLQSAINAMPAAGGVINLPIGGNSCIFSSPLSFIGKNNIKIVGGNTGIATTSTATLLIYSGGAATRAIDLRDTAGDFWQGIFFGWNNASFAGIYLDYGSQTPGTNVSFYGHVSQSAFSPFGSGSPTAVTCTNFSEAIEWTVEQTGFNSCGIAIHGQNILGQSTVAHIIHNQFFQSFNPPINQCGEAWEITNNTFEELQNGRIGAFTNSSTLPCKGIKFDTNWIGDATADGGTGIDVFGDGVFIVGGWISGHSSTSNVGIGLEGNIGFIVEGVEFDNLSTAVEVFSGTPNGGVVAGNAFQAATVGAMTSGTFGSATSTTANASF